MPSTYPSPPNVSPQKTENRIIMLSSNLTCMYPKELKSGYWRDKCASTINVFVFFFFNLVRHNSTLLQDFFPPLVPKSSLLIPCALCAKSLQSCLTLCEPMDSLWAHSPPGFSVHGISQARILERVAMSSSRGSSSPRRCPSCFLHWQMGSLPLVQPGKPC